MHKHGVKLNATPKQAICFSLFPSPILVIKKEIQKKEGEKVNREGKVKMTLKKQKAHTQFDPCVNLLLVM